MAELRTLVAGHVTHDRFGPRLRAGGALYCARVHEALGAPTRLITAVGRDFACAAELGSLDWRARIGERTTCFANFYPEVGPRMQRLEAIADPLLPPADEDADWDVLHLAPVIGELDLALWKRSVRARVIGVNVQGWLRAAAAARPGKPGREVRPLRWEPSPELLAGIDVAALSEEDLAGQGELLERLIRSVPIVALTRGAQGCDLFVDRGRIRLAADAARCVDPTGAGDAFAAALLHGIARGSDPVQAARRASAIAAIVIGAEATSGLS